MNTSLPNEQQRKALCEILADAFTELRSCNDEPERVHDLAYTFHNLPLEMYGWGTWEPDRLRSRLQRYRERYPDGPDYPAMLDRIIPPESANS